MNRLWSGEEQVKGWSGRGNRIFKHSEIGCDRAQVGTGGGPSVGANNEIKDGTEVRVAQAAFHISLV